MITSTVSDVLITKLKHRRCFERSRFREALNSVPEGRRNKELNYNAHGILGISPNCATKFFLTLVYRLRCYSFISRFNSSDELELNVTFAFSESYRGGLFRHLLNLTSANFALHREGNR